MPFMVYVADYLLAACGMEFCARREFPTKKSVDAGAIRPPLYPQVAACPVLPISDLSRFLPRSVDWLSRADGGELNTLHPCRFQCLLHAFIYNRCNFQTRDVEEPVARCLAPGKARANQDSLAVVAVVVNRFAWVQVQYVGRFWEMENKVFHSIPSEVRHVSRQPLHLVRLGAQTVEQVFKAFGAQSHDEVAMHIVACWP